MSKAIVKAEPEEALAEVVPESPAALAIFEAQNRPLKSLQLRSAVLVGSKQLASVDLALDKVAVEIDWANRSVWLVRDNGNEYAVGLTPFENVIGFNWGLVKK